MPSPGVPFPPMEAELVEALPEEAGWQYEPKWDGFRGVLENDGGEPALWSRNGRPLLRYFPELAPLGARLPPGSALDGEIVLEQEGRLDFDLLQLRLHPAESRIRRLSVEIPARYVVFDLLLWAGEPVWQLPLEERRARLERLPLDVSPASLDPAQGRAWLEGLEALGLDGVVCKRLGLPYLPGSRQGAVKVKRRKTADCVVVGVRWRTEPTRIATLLLGLYDGKELRYVGFCPVAPGLHDTTLRLLRPLLAGAPERGFSQTSRWGSRGLAESAVRPEMVVEVLYDKVERDRFRHGTRFLRFRTDKDPEACTLDQVRPRPRPGDPTLRDLLHRA